MMTKIKQAVQSTMSLLLAHVVLSTSVLVNLRSLLGAATWRITMMHNTEIQLCYFCVAQPMLWRGVHLSVRLSHSCFVSK